MGIPISIDIRDAPDERTAGEAMSAAFEVLRSADERFSPFRSNSELRRYERGETTASADLVEVFEIARWAGIASSGAFSIHAPDGSLDTNGVVKGWAAQRAAEELLARGVRNFCLNAGGDVVTHGEPEPGRPWRTGVRDPGDPRRVVAVVEQHDGAVATSGTYERGAHVWDGRTGGPARTLVAATVVADSLTTADVLATCVLVLGPEGVAWAIGQGARDAFAVLPGGGVVTAGAQVQLPAGVA
ncbi:FAD:protein FMN transferase [Sanguibacter gelidistatuariae]|nr:FAD:protein FMN transferase [Sanguibacter gelidistatuariae]